MTPQNFAPRLYIDCPCYGKSYGSSSGAGELRSGTYKQAVSSFIMDGAGEAHEFGGRASGRGSIRGEFDDPALFAVPDLVERLKT